MPQVVLDASVALRWYFPGERNETFDAIKRRIEGRADVALVPPHFLFECFSAIFRRMHSPGDRQLTLRAAQQALAERSRSARRIGLALRA